ncbi:hypothetical protein ABZ848_46815 [Streptomyces sp. NPDC047081]|uniref:hypothetical protein n=1 Tax=Streptomyces sp. NPDC047081 TaxID=3154706 RepID=UPI00340E5AF6
MTQAGLFDLEAVVVRQPKRSLWRRYTGPVLSVSTMTGTPLASVTYTDDTHLVVTEAAGQLIARIEQFRSRKFRFTDAAGQEVGSADAPGLMKTRQLRLHTPGQRRLLLTRPGLPFIQWQLTETDPEESPAPEILGRVTVSTVDSWIGLQQYGVETDPRLDPGERRTVLASVICLHHLRRPPSDRGTPA